MGKSLYITATDSRCGKAMASLGIMNLLVRKSTKISFFRPIIGTPKDERDKHIDLIMRHFPFLDINYPDTHVFTQQEVQALLGQGKHDYLIEKILQHYKALEERSDFVLCEGTNLGQVSKALALDLNAKIAKTLGAPVLLISKARGESPTQLEQSVLMAVESYVKHGSDLLGAIIMGVPLALLPTVKERLSKTLPTHRNFLACIPHDQNLDSPALDEVVEQLGAQVLYGAEKLSNKVFRNSIAAMHIDNYLSHVTENCLVVTPGDRSDIILGTLMADQSTTYPHVAGICLTANLLPSEAVKKILEGRGAAILPIISVPTNTYETAQQLLNIQSELRANNHEKIQVALQLFDDYVPTEDLEKRLMSFTPAGMTPKMFEYNLVKQAKASKKHIVLPEGNEERILRAASELLARDICQLTLLGNVEEVKGKISTLGLSNLQEVPVLDPTNNERLHRYAEVLFELRKAKGVTMEMALDMMSDVSYFGTMMVHLQEADGMVSGSVHTTQHTILPALQIVKTVPESSIVSSVFFMCLENRVLVYGDCAVNTNPTAEQLAEIAMASARTAIAFGIEPKVAMLSYSSGDSGKGEEVDKVRKATEIVKNRWPQLKVEGPIQYDAAVDKVVGKQKLPKSEVAGEATVLVFPDLNTGNNTYKAVQRETGAIAIGPVLQGLNKPVNDLSRGCTIPDIVNTVVITAIQAQQTK